MMKNILKPFKYVYEWFRDSFLETLNQSWTLLGMFAAWLVLEGSAKTVVGYATLFTLFIWLLTIRIRD
jgi:hypothetical protein